MKKRLFSILTILGIGVSYCSANDLNINFLNSNPLYNDSFSLLENNFYFNITGFVYNNNGCYRRFPIDGMQTIQFTGFLDDLYLTKFCFPISYEDNLSAYTLTLNNITYSSLYFLNSNNNIICSDFNTPINLKDTNYSFTYSIQIYGNSNFVSTLCSFPFGYFSNSSYNYIGLGDNKYLGFDILYNNYENGYGYVGSPVSLSVSFPSSPKFKVNYGNTSFEYELDSDLSIYLKSPVVQSGNTFSYAGSTGLNLFYNNTSQRYNKSNLYLDSMFWYNKNIFTPICL